MTNLEHAKRIALKVYGAALASPASPWALVLNKNDLVTSFYAALELGLVVPTENAEEVEEASG